MKSREVHPPWVASWLVDLFAPTEQAETIEGDLLEEFSDLAVKSGPTFACRWYWRQSVKTIAYLVRSGFRVEPWQIAGAVVGGFLLYFLCAGRLEQAVIAVISVGRKPHLNAYYTWPQAQARIRLIEYGVLVGHFLLSLLVGCIVAMAVKGREMVATITLGFAHWVLQAALFLAWSARHEHAVLPLQLITPLAISIMDVAGGVIVRKCRSTAGRRPSST